MSKIEKPIEQSATPINEADWAALTETAQDLAPSDFIGMPLKFVKGKWLVKTGKEETMEVTATMTFVVDPVSYSEGWVKWVDKRPVVKLVARRVDGWVSPTREALPDQDRSRWPLDAKAGPKDPWAEVQRIVMKCLDDDELLTWESDSYGGRLCLGEFFKAYVSEAKQHLGADPVVLLQSWNRPTTDWGNVATPRMKIIDWRPFGPDRTPPGNPASPTGGNLARRALETALAPPKPGAAPALAIAGQSRRDKMDDEIPF